MGDGRLALRCRENGVEMRARNLTVLLVGAICAAALALPGVAAAGFGPTGSFASYGEDAGQFANTGGLAVGPDGRIYQADYGAHRINVFSAQGAFLFTFGANVSELTGSICTVNCRAGTASEGAGGLNHPEDVAIDELGRILVADFDNNRISVFAADGEFLAAFGKDVNTTDGSDICTTSSGCLKGAETAVAGALDNPRGLDVDGAFTLVADTENNRIAVFDQSFQFLAAFGAEVKTGGGYTCSAASGCQEGEGGGAAGEMNGPTDVAFASPTLLAVADGGNDRIDVFDGDANFLRAFGAAVNASNGSGICTAVSGCQVGAAGAGAGALGFPAHLAYDNAGSVYAGDTELDRVSQVNLDTGFVRAFGAGVVNGAAAFQVCTVATGCAAGLDSAIPGATANPYGVAVASDGSILVAEEAGGMGSAPFARIERFGFVPDPPAPPAPPAPANQFKFGKLKLNKKAGTATLTITVPGAGNAVLKGTWIKKVKKAAKKAGKLSLPVKLKGKAKEKLLEKGKATVTAKITFTPNGGAGLTKKKKLTLKKTLP